MRATVHLVSARDCLELSALTRPVTERAYRGSPLRPLVSTVDVPALVETGRALLTERPPLFPGNGAGFGTILVDGDHRGTWRLDRSREPASLVVERFARLSTSDRDELAAEGARLLRFIGGTAGEVRFAVP